MHTYAITFVTHSSQGPLTSLLVGSHWLDWHPYAPFWCCCGGLLGVTGASTSFFIPTATPTCDFGGQWGDDIEKWYN